MLEIGKMENIMVLAPFYVLMVAYIKVNGVIVEKMARESLLVAKAQFMKVNGSKETIMVVENYKHMKARFMLVLSRMENI